MLRKFTTCVIFVGCLSGLAPLDVNFHGKHTKILALFVYFVNIGCLWFCIYFDAVHHLKTELFADNMTMALSYLNFFARIFAIAAFYLLGYRFKADIEKILATFREIDKQVTRKTRKNQYFFCDFLSYLICLIIFLTHFQVLYSKFDLLSGTAIILLEYNTTKLFILLLVAFLLEFQTRQKLVNEFLAETLFLINNKLLLPPQRMHFEHNVANLWAEVVHNSHLQFKLRQMARKFNFVFQTQITSIFNGIFVRLVIIFYVMSWEFTLDEHFIYDAFWYFQLFFDVYCILIAFTQLAQEVNIFPPLFDGCFA